MPNIKVECCDCCDINTNVIEVLKQKDRQPDGTWRWVPYYLCLDCLTHLTMELKNGLNLPHN